MPEQKEEQTPSALVLIFLFISSPIVAFLLYQAFHSF
jgi:multisubunit Na+/H+ antiporter MnhG subunit